MDKFDLVKKLGKKIIKAVRPTEPKFHFQLDKEPCLGIEQGSSELRTDGDLEVNWDIEPNGILRGWVFDPGAVVELQVVLDGEVLYRKPCNRARLDVFRDHLASFSSLAAGFELEFPLDVLVDIGPGRLLVQATSVNGVVELWSWSGAEATANEAQAVQALKRHYSVLHLYPSLFARGVEEPGTTVINLNVVVESSGKFSFLKRNLEALGRCATSHKGLKLNLKGIFVLLQDEVLIDDFNNFKSQLSPRLRNIVSIASESDFKSWKQVGDLGSKQQRSFLLYANEEYSLEHLSVESLVLEYIKSSYISVLQVAVYGQGAFPMNATIGSLAELQSTVDLERGSLLLPESKLGPVWLSDLAFLVQLEDLSGRQSVALVKPPVNDAFVYHTSLLHAVSIYESTATVYDPVSIDIVGKLFELNVCNSKELQADTYFILPNTFEQSTQYHGVNYQVLYLAELARAAGRKVIFITAAEGDKESSAVYTIAGYPVHRLSTISRYREGMQTGQVYAVTWETLPTARAVAYVTDSQLIRCDFTEFNETGIDYEKRGSIGFAQASDYVSLELNPRAQDRAVCTLVPKVNQSIFYQEQSERIATSLLICLKQELSPHESNVLALAINEINNANKEQVFGLVYPSKQRVSAALVACFDDCFVSPSSAELADLYRSYEAVVIIGDSGIAVIDILEAAACGAKVIASDSVKQARFTKLTAYQDLDQLPRILNSLDNYEQPSLQSTPEVNYETLLHNFNLKQQQLEQRLKDARSKTVPATVIVPVYGALDAVKECIESLKKYLDPKFDLIIVNDASDSYCTEWLRAQAANWKKIKLIEHESNQGFVAACHSGVKAAKADSDIILLNSDVVITKAALTRLQEAAYSRPEVALASPLSTNSIHLKIDLNPGDSLDQAAEFIGQHHKPDYPTIITAEGQCLYIRRWALERFGFFDRAFGRGYCEESDLCMRMFSYGADMVCADNALIFHRRAASFGEKARHAWYENNRKIFDQRWKQVYEFCYAEFVKRQVIQPVRRFYNANQLPLVKHPDDFHFESLLGSIEKTVKSAGKSTAVQTLLGDTEIVFVFARALAGGGNMSVLQHINELLERGIKARVLCLDKDLTQSFPSKVNPIEVSADQFFALDWKEQKVVATFWGTAYFVKELQRRFPKLNAYYYVQDYEPWFYPRASHMPIRKEVEKTYELGLKMFAKTEFLAKTVKENHNKLVELITPGIDRYVFYPGSQENYFGPPRLAMLYRTRTARRGHREALVLLRKLKERIPELELSFFGDKLEESDDEFINSINCVGVLTQGGVAELYRKTDVVLDMSYWQGFGRMGIEGMACGAVAALTRSGGVERYATDEVNSVMFDIEEQEQALNKLVRLLLDREYRLQLREQAFKDIQNISEQQAVSDLLSLFGITEYVKTTVQDLKIVQG